MELLAIIAGIFIFYWLFMRPERSKKLKKKHQRETERTVAQHREAQSRKKMPQDDPWDERTTKQKYEDRRQRNELDASRRRQEAEARNRKDEVNRQRLEESEKQRKAGQAKKDEELESARKEKLVAAEKLTKKFTSLKSNLPFYISNRTPSAELADHDKKMWEDVTELVQKRDSKQATLYFVKIRSLLDDNEYYKIGITTTGVKARFQKSTQLELLETVCSFDTELWKAAYLEYHFLREFRLYDGLASSLGELRPEVGFSGYTEVVRSNSVNKISEFFGELDVYNKLD